MKCICTKSVFVFSTWNFNQASYAFCLFVCLFTNLTPSLLPAVSSSDWDRLICCLHVPAFCYRVNNARYFHEARQTLLDSVSLHLWRAGLAW